MVNNMGFQDGPNQQAEKTDLTREEVLHVTKGGHLSKDHGWKSCAAVTQNTQQSHTWEGL